MHSSRHVQAQMAQLKACTGTDHDGKVEGEARFICTIMPTNREEDDNEGERLCQYHIQLTELKHLHVRDIRHWKVE